jgi:Flp pilus assembly protein TadD
MVIMKTRELLVLGIVASFVLVGCKAKEPTSLERKEAATLVSEAQFALQLKDYARAEVLLAKATALCPDTGKFWVDLGAMRVRLGKKDAARSAYKSALDAYESAAKSDPKDSKAWLQQLYVLALLGRTDDARAVLAKAQKAFPDDRAVRAFVEGKQIDKMTTDPRFKEIAL